MLRTPSIHPTLSLDSTVSRANESELHWSIKAAIVHRFQSDPTIRGQVEAEKKTSELVADIRCRFGRSPSTVPKRCVVEIQTDASEKNVLRATTSHLRHGYAVYWVYDVEALDERTEAEEALADQLSSTPSLGLASLEDGELTLGHPITWEEFEFRPPLMGSTELYVPTYDRSEPCYDHGHFSIHGERVAIYQVAGEPGYFVSRGYDDGQQTLPERAPWTGRELYRAIEDGDARRVSPVRGPP